MCTVSDVHPTEDAFGSMAEALRAGGAVADFLNSPAAAGLDGLACGEVLSALGEIQGKLAAAYAGFLRRFDAAGAHGADGYGSTSAWLAAKGRLNEEGRASGGTRDAPAGRAAPPRGGGGGGGDHPVVGAGGRRLDAEASGRDARGD